MTGKTNGGIGIWLVAGLTAALLISYPGHPPTPMPWQSSSAQDVDIVDSDYEVLRFWNCGWAGDCPLKQWKYCLDVTPKEPLAAVLWHSRAHDDPADVIAHVLDKTPLPNWSVTTRASLEGQIAYLKREGDYRHLLPKLEKLLTDVTRIESDPTAAADILNKTRAGLPFTASYDIVGEDKRSSGWMIHAGCSNGESMMGRR